MCLPFCTLSLNFLDVGDIVRTDGFHDGLLVGIILQHFDVLLGFAKLRGKTAHCIDELLRRCIVNLVKAELQRLDDVLTLIVRALI